MTGLFELVADEVTVPTSEGEFTLGALLERARGKVYVTQADRVGSNRCCCAHSNYP